MPSGNKMFCPHCGEDREYDKPRTYIGFSTHECCTCKNRIVRFTNPDYQMVYKNIVRKMKNIWRSVLEYYYTDHTPEHSSRVLKYAEEILLPLKTTNNKLSQEEFFLLTLGAYLHDIAMQKIDPVLRNDIIRLRSLSTEEFKREYPDDDQFRYIDNKYKEIRKKHATHSSKEIEELFKNQLNSFSALQNRIEKAVIYICACHSGDIIGIDKDYYPSVSI